METAYPFISSAIGEMLSENYIHFSITRIRSSTPEFTPFLDLLEQYLKKLRRESEDKIDTFCCTQTSRLFVIGSKLNARKSTEKLLQTIREYPLGFQNLLKKEYKKHKGEEFSELVEKVENSPFETRIFIIEAGPVYYDSRGIRDIINLFFSGSVQHE